MRKRKEEKILEIGKIEDLGKRDKEKIWEIGKRAKREDFGKK